MVKSIFLLLSVSLAQLCYSQSNDSVGIKPLIANEAASQWMNMGRGEVRIIVPSEHTNGAWSLLERKETPWFQTDLHRHNKMDEAFYVLQGELTVFINDTIYKLTTGSYVLIPKKTPHAQANLTSDTTRILSFFMPGGFEKFAIERAEITKKYGSNTDKYKEELYKSLIRHDMEILGPPPFKK